jgi:hypothetical protein
MRKTLILLLVLVLFPVPAMAQTDKHVALGAEIGFRHFVDDHFSRKNPSFSVLYRLSRNPSMRKQGWVWRLGGTVGYSHTDFDTDVGGLDTGMGSLRTIPALVGIERAYRHDRMKVALSALAGPSFNKFSVDGASRDTYEARLGVPLENIEVKNSVAVRSGVGVWYDLSSRVGLHAGAYYLYHRPSATTTAGGVSSSETWRMDRVSLSTGLAIGIF